MLALKEADQRISDILKESIDGRMHEKLEDYLNDFKNDYHEFYEQAGDTGTVSMEEYEQVKNKYDDLRQKYVDRFMGEPIQTVMNHITTETRDKEGDVDEIETDTIEDITISDLFEEVK